MIQFIWRRQCPPGFVGGAEISEHAIAAYLASCGAKVRYLGCHQHPWPPHDSNLTQIKHELDSLKIPWEQSSSGITYIWNGVECHLTTQSMFDGMLERFITRRGVVWTSQEGCQEVSKVASNHNGIATYIHSISPTGLLSTKINAKWVFVPSKFVADIVSQSCKPLLFRPPITWELYRSSFGSRSGVLFFNPITEKGVNLAITLARSLSSTPFQFVEGWWDVTNEIIGFPRNVEYIRKLPDPRILFRKNRLLIVPSEIQDASPRVILEAISQGCPVLGAPVGGIPEYLDDAYLCRSTQDWWNKTRRITTNIDVWNNTILKQMQHNQTSLSNPFSPLHDSGLVQEALKR